MRLTGQIITLFIGLSLLLFSPAAFAVKEYTWDGSESSDWNDGDNWDVAPGTGVGARVYIIGGPGTYTNAPVISSTFAQDVDYIDLKDGAQLTVTGGNSEVDDDIAVYGGSDLVISGGTLSTQSSGDDLFIYDNGSSVTVSGGTLDIAGNINLGLQHPSRADGTNGSPNFTVSSGTATCVNLVFDDAEGDTPDCTISGGELETSGDVRSDGANVDITISSTGLLDINDDLEMDGGSDDLTMSNGNLTIAGDWTNTGSTNLTGGTITFDGGSAQQITNTSGETFYNLTISNTSTGITLNDPITIANSMTFTDGVVIASSTNRVIFNDDATASGSSSASYVDGYVRKIGNDAFTFPVGNSSNYQPLSISAPSSATDQFSAAYIFSDPSAVYGWGYHLMGSGLDRASTEEYWDLNRDNGSSSISVTLAWNSNSGGVSVLSEMRVAHWTGSEWEDVGNTGTTGNTSSGTVTSGSVSSFSSFTLGTSTSNNALPVELTRFEAYLEEETVQLEWETATEWKNDYFEVQKSSDGKTFTTIHQEKSKAEYGASNELLSYFAKDQEVEQGMTFYRLKQVDLDGSYEYSSVVGVNKHEVEHTSQSFAVYPSPQNVQQLQVQFSDDMALMKYRLINSDGREFPTVSQSIESDLQQVSPMVPLSPGIYHLQASYPDGRPYGTRSLWIR